MLTSLLTRLCRHTCTCASLLKYHRQTLPFKWLQQLLIKTRITPDKRKILSSPSKQLSHPLSRYKWGDSICVVVLVRNISDMIRMSSSYLLKHVRTQECWFLTSTDANDDAYLNSEHLPHNQNIMKNIKIIFKKIQNIPVSIVFQKKSITDKQWLPLSLCSLSSKNLELIGECLAL